MSEYLSCLQTAHLLGVSQSTVKRMCDDQVLPSQRTPGGHRRIPSKYVQQWVRDHRLEEQVPRPLKRHDKPKLTIPRVLRLLLGGESATLAEDILAQIRNKGNLAKLLDDVIAPSMWEVGRRWESGEMDVSGEHACSDTLQASLAIVAAELEPTPKVAAKQHSSSPRAIGGCLGSELHSLASTMIALVLKHRGWRARSLGGFLPKDSLITALTDFEPDVVWLSYARITHPEAIYQENAEIFARLRPGQRLVIGGQALTARHRKKLQFHFIGDSFEHLVRYATQLREPVYR